MHPPPSTPVPAQTLIDRFDEAGLLSLVLLGSHARGEAGPHSDIDLLGIVPVGDKLAAKNQSVLIDGHLVVVNHVDLDRVEQWFTHPHLAILTVGGLCDAIALVDRHDTFKSIRERAISFTWSDAIRERAAEWIGRTMVDGIEEVHKALNGLRNNDEGKLLAARHVLTWDLLRIAQVHCEILPRSDRDAFEATIRAVGEGSAWSTALRDAFGMGKPTSLADQLAGGLRLYIATAELVAPALRNGRNAEQAGLIHATVARIRSALLQ